MAVYKVPQDVEAEDKLIGPFGFRQFIYLLIAAGAGGLTFLFIRAPIPIPLFSIFSIPVALGMVALALPLRKDQPMEIYLAAVLRFMLKPKRRLWTNDGLPSGVTIDAPVVIQRQLARDITQDQALNQLTYLSRLVDSRGWAAKGVDTPESGRAAAGVASPPDPDDVLDENAAVAKSFDSLLQKQKEQSRQEIMERMKGGTQSVPAGTSGPAPANASETASQSSGTAPAAGQDAAAPAPQPVTDRRGPGSYKGRQAADDNSSAEQPRFNPYPTMHQQVLSPLDRLHTNTFHAPGGREQTEHANLEDDSGKLATSAASQDDNKQQTGMTPQLSPDIMRLANNNDLSIQTIANEAHRAQKADEDEVVVELH